MGAYWGSKYISYLSLDPFKCKVVQVDLKPCGVNETSDALFLPLDDQPELKDHTQHADIPTAVLEVKKHILSTTSWKICELLSAIEFSKHDIEYMKLVEPNRLDLEEWIATKKEDIEKMSAELKALRKLRRAKVAVV